MVTVWEGPGKKEQYVMKVMGLFIGIGIHNDEERQTSKGSVASVLMPDNTVHL